MARNKRLKWTNKWSGESGYVKVVRETKGYFESTYDINEARKFKSVRECEDAIDILHNIGEAQNNNFEIVDVG